jgi:pyridoxamine 5'-phosphate oxidase family protein
MILNAADIEYLHSQRLGRLATIGADGKPHVVPVTYRYNDELGTIDIGGHGFGKSKKWRDVHANAAVAFVVDDIASTNPWKVRGVEVRGDAEVLTSGGADLMRGFDDEMIRIRPMRVHTWGLGP